MLRSSFGKEMLKKIPGKESQTSKEEKAPKYVAVQEVEKKKPEDALEVVPSSHQEPGGTKPQEKSNNHNAIKISYCENPGHRL